MTESPMASAPAGPPPESMGLFARLTGIYTAPNRVFRHLVERPRWIAIVMVVALAVGLLNFAMLSTETGRTMMREQMEAQMRGSSFTLTEAQMEQQMKFGRFFGLIAPFIFLPLLSLLVTVLVYVIFNLFMGGEAKFRQVLAICAHVYPIFILHSVLTTLLILVKGSAQATTSLVAFLPFLEPDSLPYRLFQGIDPFFLWEIGLLALGTSILYRKPFGRCATVLYAVYLVFVIGIGTLVWKVTS